MPPGAGPAGEEERPLGEADELFLLIGELEHDLAQERRARAAERASQPQAQTVAQLAQQAGLIARSVMEADEARSELRALQLAKQALAEELREERSLRQRADADVAELRARADESLAMQRQLGQELLSERSVHDVARETLLDNSADLAELKASRLQLESQLAIEQARHAEARSAVETQGAAAQAELASVRAANERLQQLADEHQHQSQLLRHEVERLQATHEQDRAQRREDAKLAEALRAQLAEERAAHDATRLTLLSELEQAEAACADQQPHIDRLNVEKKRLRARVSALQVASTTPASSKAKAPDTGALSPDDTGSPRGNRHLSPEASSALFERLHRSGRRRADAGDSHADQAHDHDQDPAVTDRQRTPRRGHMSRAAAAQRRETKALVRRLHHSRAASSEKGPRTPTRATLLARVRKLGGTAVAANMVRHGVSWSCRAALTARAQATATAAELEALLASRRYTLLGRLLQEQPGPELMNALRAAPEDELQEHVADFDRRNMF